MEIQECEIPVPWGVVAGKIWGNSENEPILCFHGLMDNAGTFNRLIPLLPPHFRYICIDLPCHGKSSPFPPHLPVFTINYFIVYDLIMKYFGRESYILLGHSYGGQIGFSFAQIYPERVKKLIMLDTIHIFPISANYCSDYLEDKINVFLTTEEKLKSGRQPTYTYEEAVEKLRIRRNDNTLSREASLQLFERLAVPVGDNRYKFNMDQRMKNFINPLHDFQYILKHMKLNPVKCPVLIILAKKSRPQQIYMKSILNVLKKRKNVLIKHVEGDHDVHLENPENVERYITKFLITNSKL